METTPHRNSNRRTSRTGFRRLIASFAILTASCSQLRADIPWPEVVQRLAYENEKLARRPQGHNGEYFVVCKLYYTPIKSSQRSLRHGAIVETFSPEVQKVFRSNRWRIMDTGGGLRRWQIDCYFGEDEPLGPGKLQGRPRATTFEYAYANARIVK